MDVMDITGSKINDLFGLNEFQKRAIRKTQMETRKGRRMGDVSDALLSILHMCIALN